MNICSCRRLVSEASVKNECDEHSACMCEDRNSDLSYGQLSHSVGISQSIVEEEKNLESLKVSYHE